MRAAVVVLCLAALVSVALGCSVPPGGCKKATCDSYAGLTMMNPSRNYSADDTWSLKTMKVIALYLGVSNKAFTFPKARNKYAKWWAMRDDKLPSLNYEKFDLTNEPAPVLLAQGSVSLADCCNLCRVAAGCPLYQLVPDSRSPGEPIKGKCYKLTGGKDPNDGPFTPEDPSSTSIGVPFSGTSVQQAASNIRPTFIGGFCNPLPKVDNDPHFTGAHGTRFDFNGELGKSFCLVTDEKFHINAVLKGYKSTNTYHTTVGADGLAIRSWIRELAFLWQGGHTLKLVARNGKEQERGNGFLGSVTFDGKALAVPSEGESVVVGDLTFSNIGLTKQGPYDVERFSVKIGDLVDVAFSMRPAHRLLQLDTDAQVHFNLLINNIKATEKVHGVLGQTYRNTPAQLTKAIKYSELGRLLGEPVQVDGETGKGFLDGQIKDYESSSSTSADCKVSSFNA